MADFGPDIAAHVLAACQKNAVAAAAALAALSETEFKLIPGEAAPCPADDGGLPKEQGLIFLFEVGRQAAALLVPKSSEVLPEGFADIDAARQEQLDELAATLGKLLLPKEYLPLRSEAVIAESLAESLKQCGLADNAVRMPLAVERGESSSGEWSLIWPLNDAAALLPPMDESSQPSIGEQPPTAARRITAIDALPSYSRSLLRIGVPVVAVLARRKQKVSEILDLGPGSIIQFNKSCEQLLELQVGEQLVARGEAVKVGDKFGLRIKEVVLPEERFKRVG